MATTTTGGEISCEAFEVFAIEALKRARATRRLEDRCRNCQCRFEAETVMGYPHADGWYVASLGRRYWLYLTCEGCDYQMALWKLGLPRDWTPEGEAE